LGVLGGCKNITGLRRSDGWMHGCTRRPTLVAIARKDYFQDRRADLSGFYAQVTE